MSGRATEELREVTGRIHSRETFGTVDGPGLRYVLFLPGCPLGCLYCHNPDTLSRKGGELWTAGKLVDELLRYRSFIQNGGVTFSGGEPLMQSDFVAAACRLLRREGLHTAIDTAGCYPPESVSGALLAADLILLDIKALHPALSRTVSGQNNKNALAILAFCEKHKKEVWVRHVLLPGYTLDEGMQRQLGQYLAPFSCVQRVELLPFHKMGENKWAQLGRPYKLHDVPAVTDEEAAQARQALSEGSGGVFSAVDGKRVERRASGQLERKETP